MSMDAIQSEFDKHGRLSRQSVIQLQSLLLSDDPCDAITVAADIGCIEASPQVAQCLTSADPMVRWNAAATLFTRFRSDQFAGQCLKLVETECDEMVRSVALVGLGEMLSIIHDKDFQKRAAAVLLRVFNDLNEYPEVRCSAYEGILAALSIPPLERPSAGRLLDLAEEVDWKTVDNFASRFDIKSIE